MFFWGKQETALPYTLFYIYLSSDSKIYLNKPPLNWTFYVYLRLIIQLKKTKLAIFMQQVIRSRLFCRTMKDYSPSSPSFTIFTTSDFPELLYMTEIM